MKKQILLTLIFILSLGAESLTYTEYVSVQSSTPEYQQSNSRVPYQECYNRRVPVSSYSSHSNNYNQQQATSSAIVGGALGGVIGHQFGSGRGKDAATIGGAILGTLVAGNAARDQYNSNYNPQYAQSSQYQTKRECVTKYRYQSQQRVFVGYKNVAYYKGRKIVKYSERRLSSIPIRVTIDY